MKKFWGKRKTWCLPFRDKKVRGHKINNFLEVCIRIFKDEVLYSVKAYKWDFFLKKKKGGWGFG